MQQQSSESPPTQPGVEGHLRITDDRTGRQYEIPITDSSIRALDLRPIKVREDEFGLLSYDPGLTNTATCHSGITFIDGARGILNYRGFAIEDLSAHACHEEVAWLLWQGELPTRDQLEAFNRSWKEHLEIRPAIRALFASFRQDLHPMSMLLAGTAALLGEFPEARKVRDRENRRLQILRLFALTPVLAAMAWKRHRGEDFVEPDPGLSYAGNLLRMLQGRPGEPFQPEPAHERALDALLILHADHEQNCSANAMRAVSSSLSDPYSAAAAAIAALFGPLHGGANQAVLEMLEEIPSVEAIPAFLESCKNGERRLMGFGHRVYKSYDPRAKVIQGLAEEVAKTVGPQPRLVIARELERQALEDPYFVERKLFPNVDFYSGMIYDALGFPTDMFTVFFATGRMIGWLCHWDEFLEDPEFRIVRPRQLYTGPGPRPFVPLEQR